MGLGSGPAAMKCLCLHGRGQDAEIFSQRLRSLVRKATGKLQFVFMRAAPRLAGCTQHLCHELNYAAMRAPRRRTPISTALCCDGTVLLPLSAGQQVPMRAWSVPEDLGVVRDTWQAHAAAGAPFDGIVAFSQARLWRRALGYDRFVLLHPRSKGAYFSLPFIAGWRVRDIPRWRLITSCASRVRSWPCTLLRRPHHRRMLPGLRIRCGSSCLRAHPPCKCRRLAPRPHPTESPTTGSPSPRCTLLATTTRWCLGTPRCA